LNSALIRMTRYRFRLEILYY